MGPDAADEFGPGAGAQDIGLADLPQAQSHRHSHWPQVHSDQRAADVNARRRLDMLYCRWAVQSGPSRSGETAPRFGLGNHVDQGQAILPGRSEERRVGKECAA